MGGRPPEWPRQSSGGYRVAKREHRPMVEDPRPVLRHRPSSAWRVGFMLYDGWPAQEGSSEAPKIPRSSHSQLTPALLLEEAHSVRPEPALPVRSASWMARYPAWWTEADTPVPDAAVITPAAAPALEAAAPAAPLPLNPQVPKRLQVPNRLNAREDRAFEAPPTCSPAPHSPAQQNIAASPAPAPMQRVAAETQTTTASAPRWRGAFMPCLKRPAKVVTAMSATSKVGAALRKEATFRKQLVAARRRRLEAIVAGGDPADAPIEVVPRPQLARRSTNLDEQFEPVGEGDASTDGGWSGGQRGVTDGPDESEGLGAAEFADRALEIAQRFLGSTLGEHFVDAASGQPEPRAFDLREIGSKRSTSAAQLRVARAAASVAAAAMETSDRERRVNLSDAFPLTQGVEMGDWRPDALTDGDYQEPRDLEAVGAAVARFGLHETHNESERREAAQGRSVPPPASHADWAKTGSGSSMAMGPQNAARASAVWEIDVTSLRGSAQKAKTEVIDAEQGQGQRCSERLLRPRPAPGARRSHSGWTMEFKM